jgi:hypothetical protein
LQEPAFLNPLYTFAMALRFRTAMMWLLLLALPLQGFAAATMLDCGPNHHRMWGASIGTQAGSHDHAKHGGHRHPTNAADVDELSASGDHADGGSPLHHLDKLSKFKCSACAACCIGAALPPSPLTFLSFPPAAAPAPNVAVPYDDFVSNALDRPPRLFLA